MLDEFAFDHRSALIVLSKLQPVTPRFFIREIDADFDHDVRIPARVQRPNLGHASA